MAKDTNFFDMMERRLKLGLHTSGPAKVIAFDEDNLTADIELLHMTKDGDGDLESYPLIMDAPVLGAKFKAKNANGDIVEYIPFLEPGDQVYVCFAERAIDNWEGPNKFDPDYMRTHDIRDAVIVGVRF